MIFAHYVLVFLNILYTTLNSDKTKKKYINANIALLPTACVLDGFYKQQVRLD